MTVKYFMMASAVAMAFGLAAVSAEAADKDVGDSPFGKLAISEQSMSQLRGGTESVQTATGSGSCSLCTVDGTATINGNAFSNAAGVITVIQNTGINVVLQNATVVNVILH